MNNMKYAKSHEWLVMNGDIATVGITFYAQEQLGDVVFVEVPEVGRKVEVGGEIAVVESVKAASEIYSPVSGEVVDANQALLDSPELINQAPEAEGWIYKIKLSDKNELEALLDENHYKRLVTDLD